MIQRNVAFRSAADATSAALSALAHGDEARAHGTQAASLAYLAARMRRRGLRPTPTVRADFVEDLELRLLDALPAPAHALSTSPTTAPLMPFTRGTEFLGSWLLAASLALAFGTAGWPAARDGIFVPATHTPTVHAAPRTPSPEPPPVSGRPKPPKHLASSVVALDLAAPEPAPVPRSTPRASGRSG